MTVIKFSADVSHNKISIKCGSAFLTVSFQRTIRVPDNEETSELPPSLGNFPLYRVGEYADSMPIAMAEKGGVFLPMYQSEAMWIEFYASRSFAVKIFAGGVNIVSGENMIEDEASKLRRLEKFRRGESVQDYLVPPSQRWIDGIATHDGKVRQFVAMPVGEGYSVEAQMTGNESVSGLQFEITPINEDIARDSIINIDVKTLTGKVIKIRTPRNKTIYEVECLIQDKEGIPPDQQRLVFSGRRLDDRDVLADCGIIDGDCMYLILRLRGGGGGGGEGSSGLHSPVEEMTVAAGGLIRQTIVRDRIVADKWADTPPLTFNVQILNSTVFRAITGKPAPPSPVSPATYAQAGLPFFKLYEETSGIQGDFEMVKSVAQLKKEMGSTDETEKTQLYPLVMLNSTSATRFHSVANLEYELRKLLLADI